VVSLALPIFPVLHHKRKTMETPFLFPVEPNDFYLRLKQLIDKALNDRLSQLPLAAPPNGMVSRPLLSQKEVCDLFQITKPTVYE
jgi:hypothetical protein